MTRNRLARGGPGEEARVRGVYRDREARAVPGRYSPFNPGNLFMAQSRQRRVLRLLRDGGLESLGALRILDVGCGGGSWLLDFLAWGADPRNLAGIDILAERLVPARRRLPPGVALKAASAARIPFRNGAFDLAVQSTCFSSILDDGLRRGAAAEILRVLRPGGSLLWYDLAVGNPWNSQVRALGRREVRALFPGCETQLSRATLAPPLARVLAPLSWLLCGMLEALPPLRTHLLGFVRKPG